LGRWAEELRRRREDDALRHRLEPSTGLLSQAAPASPAPASTPAVNSAAAEADSVTNVQHAGVDEGGIVKLHGEHLVDRIEALGSNAMAVGSDGKDFHLTSLRLARFPVAVDRYIHKDAAQGETRSHGFYYKAESDNEGLLGLPIVGNGEPAARQLRKVSAALLYLRNRGLNLSELGTLEARPEAGAQNDGCRASCVDWYGNSRPLFVRGRVFALMGYEIVEGAVTERRIVETRRASRRRRWSILA
jgi:hypothetical protein